jgi:hypothetical protein
VNAKADPLLDQLLWEAKPQSATSGVPPAGGLPLVPTRQDVIRKLSYTHDALIDMIIAHPEFSQGQLANHFGYTQAWLSQVMASDAFKSKLAERKDALVDPILRLQIEERFKALVERSFEILMEKISVPASQVPDQLALRTFEIASRAAGFGARQVVPPGDINVEVHLNTLGDRLTGLLSRKRTEAQQTAIDGTCEESPSED